MENRTAFKHWAILEMFGHVRLAGLVTEEELFGGKVGRIDIPETPLENGEEVWTTQYFGNNSIYRLTPCDEDTARAVAKTTTSAPVHVWQMREAPALPRARIGGSRFDEATDEYEDAPL